jgi:hypothetical protein
MSKPVKSAGTTCAPRSLPNAEVLVSPEIGRPAASSGVIFSVGLTACRPSLVIQRIWSIWSSPPNAS